MKGKNEISEYIISYLMKGQDSNISPELEEWLSADESHRRELEQYMKIWEASGAYQEVNQFDVNSAWEIVNRKNRKKQFFHRRLKNIGYVASGIAASLLVMFMLSWVGILEWQRNMPVSVKVDRGSRSKVVFPDGSVVSLNSGSDVTYRYNRLKRVREVQFQGEGFFDVSKGKEPFVVKMPSGLLVNVLGTSFNLRAYADDESEQASLVEGVVELKCRKEKLMMQAGDMIVYDKKSNKLTTGDGFLSQTYGWQERKLYMDNLSLSDVCRQLERWYDVNITIQEGLGSSIGYNGVIQEETITDVMEVLSRLSEITYDIKGNNICITSNQLPME